MNIEILTLQVLNIHSRSIAAPKKEVGELLKTLSTHKDKVWPKEKWPAMKFKNGIGVGSNGGHGPIKYSVEIYDPENIIQFRFSQPKGFNGIHKLEVSELNNKQTEIKHTIEMTTNGKGTAMWIVAIRPLHNALIEDAFDKIENSFSNENKTSKWNLWVKLLRRSLQK